MTSLYELLSLPLYITLMSYLIFKNCDAITQFCDTKYVWIWVSIFLNTYSNVSLLLTLYKKNLLFNSCILFFAIIKKKKKKKIFYLFYLYIFYFCLRQKLCMNLLVTLKEVN